MDLLINTLKVFARIFAGTLGVLLAITCWGLIVMALNKIFKKKK